MNTFYTAVLERRAVMQDDFVTAPYECGWAREALFFATVEQFEGTNAQLLLRVQVSPDGLHWADEGTAFEAFVEVGTKFVRVEHFGGWLRLHGAMSGSEPRARVTVQLALKA